MTISSPNELFADIVLGPSDDMLPKAVEGRLGSGEPLRMRFSGSGVRPYDPVLRSVAVPQNALVNGEPSRAMDGLCYAQTLGGGYLIRLTMQEGPDVLSDTGIFSVVSSSLGPGGALVQALEIIFYPMPAGSRLYNALGTYEELPEEVEAV